MKNNNLHIPKTTIDSLLWLPKVLQNYDSNLLSISGGGDPLHNYNQHVDYYDLLFSILGNYHCKLEMHTSYLKSDFPFERCYRVVYHCTNAIDISEIKRKGKEIIRVVFVVDSNFSKDWIDEIYYYYTLNDDVDELTFRQMVDDNYTTRFYCHKYLKEGHNAGKWYYVKQCDYNDYYVNGKIYKKFADIGRESEK